MQKIIDFLARLGVVEGLTFRVEIDDGVGPVLVPNPSVNRMAVNAVPVPPRRARPRASGTWSPKLIHLSW